MFNRQNMEARIQAKEKLAARRVIHDDDLDRTTVPTEQKPVTTTGATLFGPRRQSEPVATTAATTESSIWQFNANASSHC